MHIRIQISIVLLVVLTALVFLIWRGRNQEQTAFLEEIKVPVTVTRAEYRTLERKIRFRGFVESSQSVVVYPRTMGILKKVLVTEGQRVEAGQVIAVLDNESARLNLDQAEAAYNLAAEDWARYQTLHEKNLISEQQFQNAETNYKALKTQYELAEVQFGFNQVESPISGIIQEISLDPGALVSSQVSLMSVAARGTNILKVDIPENYYESFSSNRGLPLEIIRPDSPEVIYRGKIQYVSPFISPGTMKFQVTVEIEDRGILIPGMYVEAAFVLEQRQDLLSLPYSVLTGKGKLWTVDDTGHAHSTVPEILFQGDRYFSLNEELAGAAVISEGQHFLGEGQEVRITGTEGNP